MNLRPKSFRLRIALLVVLIFIPVFLLVAFSAESQRRGAVERAEEDALALARSLGEANRQQIDNTLQMLRTLSILDSVRNQQWAECSQFFRNLHAELPLYGNIFAAEAATGLNLCSAVPRDEPFDNSRFRWFQEVVSSQRPVVSEYRIGPVSGKPVIQIGVPAFDATGKLVAVVSAGLSLDWLNDSLASASLPPGWRVTLVDRDGVILARYPEGEGLVGQPYTNSAVLQLVRTSDEGSVHTTPQDGPSRLYGYASLGPDAGDVGVVVSVPEEVALADANTSRNRSLAALAGIAFFVVAAAWASSGMLMQPVDNLTRTSRALARGQLRSRARLSTEIVELQELLDAFNDMAASVEQSATEREERLLTANRNLEREITERTEAQARTQLLQDLTAGLAEAVTVADVARVVVERGLVPLGGLRIVIASVSDDGESLVLLHEHGLTEEQKLHYTTISLDSTVPLVDAFKTGGPVWLETEVAWTSRYPELYQSFRGQALLAQSMVCLPLVVGKRTIGSLGVSFASPHPVDEPLQALLDAIGRYCAQALERARLAEVAQQAAIFEERQRLARELHDAVSQTLFSSSIMAESMERLWTSDPQKARQRLSQLVVLNRAAMAELRGLLYALRPDALENSKLSELVGQLVDAAKGRKPLATQVLVTGDSGPTSPDVRLTFYRIAQESIHNIVKHSSAAELWVELVQEETRLALVVCDNGQGFDTDAQTSGIGLRSMHERAAAIGARLEIWSEPGNGTRVSADWSRRADSEAS